MIHDWCEEKNVYHVIYVGKRENNNQKKLISIVFVEKNIFLQKIANGEDIFGDLDVLDEEFVRLLPADTAFPVARVIGRVALIKSSGEALFRGASEESNERIS